VQSPVCIILTKADLVDGKKLKEDIEEIKQHFMFLEVFAASAKEDSAACKQFSLQNLIRTTRALFPEVEKSKDKLENSMGENDEEARNKIIKIAIAAAAVVIILYWIFK
jgi:ribosome biogenesis GTPase A